MSRFIDLTGKTFGRLKVIKRVEDYISQSENRYPQWLCECNCDEHNQVIVMGTNLKQGRTNSCGCLSKENSSEQGKLAKKYNIYDLTGEYGIGYTSKGEEFYFDLEDYNLIKGYCWYINNEGYVSAREIENPKIIKMHRLIKSCNDKKVFIDHINHITIDNRKQNLRIVNGSQNAMNTRIKDKNTSGVVGVSWCVTEKKWHSYITVNGKRYQKRFDNFDDAASQRKEWEEKYFGQYSYANSMRGANGQQAI